jgi:hypothetical protein
LARQGFRPGTSLPHHRLLAYQKSLELLAAVRLAQIRDAKLRDEALRAAKGCCLNIAEGAGRVSRGDNESYSRIDNYIILGASAN